MGVEVINHEMPARRLRIGGEFDPDVFDLDKINTALQNLKGNRSRGSSPLSLPA
jgi:hypothetical protein